MSAPSYLLFDRILWPLLLPLLSPEARVAILWVGHDPGGWLEPQPLAAGFTLRDQDRAVAVLEPSSAAVLAVCKRLAEGEPGSLLLVGGGSEGLATLETWRRRVRS